MASSGGDKGDAKDLSESKSSSSVRGLSNKSESKLLPQYDPDVTPIQYKQWDGSFSTEAHDKDYLEITLKSGKHSELVQKILRQRIEQRAKEFPRWPANYNDGVRTVWIESRFWYDRERLLPDFDDDWRRYRAKYLHSLELDPREPVHVPRYETTLINPIRRFYMKGGDFIEDKIIKKFITTNKYKSEKYRILTTRFFMAYIGVLSAFYWIRYNAKKWDSNWGPEFRKSATIIYHGHPKFPAQEWHQEPADYLDLGFTKRGIFNDLRDFEDTRPL